MQEPEQKTDTTVVTLKDPPYYRLNPETGEKIAITRAEYKDAMRKEFTVKRPVNPGCGHKFIQGSEPKFKNCEHCWFAYFQVHGQWTQAAEALFQEHGKAGLVQMKGKTYAENFLKFMSTVAQYKAAADAAKQNTEGSDEQRTGSTEGGSEVPADSSTDAGNASSTGN